jgi:uncharacterized protein with HEPN domain
MDIEIKAWLYDILNAINEIESFLLDFEEFNVYKNDLKTRRAVERNVEIIGEAMSRILQKNASIELSNSRKIVDTRNRIITDTTQFLTKLFGLLLFPIYPS